jgi:hypothetical protein
MKKPRKTDTSKLAEQEEMCCASEKGEICFSSISVPLNGKEGGLLLGAGLGAVLASF